MDKSVFVKSNEAVLYLVSGKKDALNLPVLDSTASEGAGEKHLPVVTCSGKNITVKVGSVAHPHVGRAQHRLDFPGDKEGWPVCEALPAGGADSAFCAGRAGRGVRRVCILQPSRLLENRNIKKDTVRIKRWHRMQKKT